jgi:hypothetical protein
MGLLEISTSVLTTYRADTSDQKAKLKELGGLEKEHAAAELAAAEARNKHADNWIDKLGKVGLAFNAVTQLARSAFEGLEHYGHRLDLEATAGSVSIDKLSKAAAGAKSNMELLTHAAVYNKSAFQLTEEQMATVEQGMHALEERGKDGAEVWSAVSTVLTKGTTKALEGLIGPIQKSSDAFDVNGDVIQTYGARAKAVDAILKQLASTSKELGDGQGDEADRIHNVTINITNAMDNVKDSMGKMVVALGPLISGVAALAGPVGYIVDKVSTGWQDISDLLSLYGGTSPDEIKKRLSERHHIDMREGWGGDRWGNWIAGGNDPMQLFNQLQQNEYKRLQQQLSFSVGTEAWKLTQRGEDLGEQAMALLVEGADKMKKRYEKGKQVAAALLEERKKLANEVAKLGGEELLKQLEDEQGGVSFTTFAMWHASEVALGATGRRKGSGQWDSFVDDNRVTSVPGLTFGRDIGSSSETRLDEQLGGLPGARSRDSSDIEAAMRGYYGDYFKTGSATSQFGKIMQQNKTQSFLEQTFGKVEEFNVYKSAFDSLSSAVVAGFGAWIDGSKSFGSAFREALGKTMAGEALSMAAQALKATALGIFSAATGDAPHAALYFTSAAEFAAAAVAFGVGAAVLGGGGGSAPRGAGGGSGASAPNVTGGAGASSPTQSIVVITDSFAEDSARMKQIRAERVIALARGKNGIEYA